MAITDIQISEELETSAPSIKYSGNEGPKSPQEIEMMMADVMLEEEYNKDLTLEDAKVVALRAVKAAITRNIGTGDGINVALVDKNGFRLLTEEQKKAVLPL